jgi:hypothetical protein
MSITLLQNGKEIKQIKISRNKDITTLSFAHNQVTVADSEDFYT